MEIGEVTRCKGCAFLTGIGGHALAQPRSTVAFAFMWDNVEVGKCSNPTSPSAGHLLTEEAIACTGYVAWEPTEAQD